jgi:octaprenyl-diphosphate synthase
VTQFESSREGAERASETAGTTDVLERLRAVCTTRGLDALGDKLAELGALVAADMADVEQALHSVERGERVIHQAGHHLLDLGGKRLRPLCVILAAKVGSGVDQRVRDLAVAVEITHAATLLHDDVVDVGDKRRGALTARAVYGNAASIFAGDWLLVEALRRVAGSGVPGALERLLSVIETMIFAEAIQLENRGRLGIGPEEWLKVVEGKTASLFRWAMFAGARAGGLDDKSCAALEAYGEHLGVAFQAVDDVLDLTGDHRATGKALFTDLREGKMTYPLIVALERDPDLRPVVEEIVRSESAVTEPVRAQVLASLAETGAVRDCLALARARVEEARNVLEVIPAGPAKDALRTVAETAVSRRT